MPIDELPTTGDAAHGPTGTPAGPTPPERELRPGGLPRPDAPVRAGEHAPLVDALRGAELAPGARCIRRRRHGWDEDQSYGPDERFEARDGAPR